VSTQFIFSAEVRANVLQKNAQNGRQSVLYLFSVSGKSLDKLIALIMFANLQKRSKQKSSSRRGA
jgi:hypothetical protein